MNLENLLIMLYSKDDDDNKLACEILNSNEELLNKIVEHYNKLQSESDKYNLLHQTIINIELYLTLLFKIDER